VSWMEEDDVRLRMQKVHEEVGRQLSRFSHKIREHWQSASFQSPQEVREQYQRAMRVCPNFFRHNERDFKDPYLDLLVCIRQEYRRLSTSRMTSVKQILRRWVRSVTYQAKRIQLKFAVGWAKVALWSIRFELMLGRYRRRRANKVAPR
jgi:hypothetical protein